MNLLIVIVNYCSAPLVRDALDSLEQCSLPGMSVVVTDCASPDGSATTVAQLVARSRLCDCRFMALEHNGGFAYGNNAAIARALAGPQPPRYVLLLNPDTVVRPGGVEALVRFMDEHPDAGIAGSRLEMPDGTAQRSAFRFPSIWSELEAGLRFGPASKLLQRHVVAPPPPRHACRVDWVAGASMLIRREVFESIGLLDEGFFMYFEEVDFCRRAQRAGWPTWYVPGSRVVHLVGQSSGVTCASSRPRRRPAYWFQSRQRYFTRHHGHLYASAADLTFVVGRLLDRGRRLLQRKAANDPPAFLTDLLRCTLTTGGLIRC